MATYNGEKYIREQINSILQQTYKDIRLIIHDDGSSDNTVAIVKEYVDANPDTIVYVEDGIKTGGAKNNFHHLFSYSNSEYIMFADQDDIWKASKVESALNAIMDKEKIHGKKPLLGYSDLVVVDAELKVINQSFFDMQNLVEDKNCLNNLLVQNIVTGCTCIFNRELLEMCNEMPKEAIMHDWWLALVAAAFGDVFLMDDKYILYRQHGNNTEGAKDCKNISYIMKQMFNPKAITTAINATFEQAVAFEKIYGEKLDGKNKEILNKYITIKHLSKLKRIKSLKENGFEKNGFMKKMVQKLFV